MTAHRAGGIYQEVRWGGPVRALDPKPGSNPAPSLTNYFLWTTVFTCKMGIITTSWGTYKVTIGNICWASCLLLASIFSSRKWE